MTIVKGMAPRTRSRGVHLADGEVMTPPCRVLHVLPDLQRSGGQIVVLQLVSHADRDRFQVYVAGLQQPNDLAPAFGQLGSAPIRLDGGGVLAATLRIARRIRVLEIDIVHVHSTSDRKVGQLAALLTGRPVVNHLHSPWAHLSPMHREDAGRLSRRWSRLKAGLRTALERRVVRHHVAAGDEVAHFFRGLLYAPITVARNGVDVAHFAPATSDARRLAREQLRIGADAQVLVCVGRLVAGKGQDELIATLAHLPEVLLVLVGEGPERSSLTRMAIDGGVYDRVCFVGEHDDVAAVLPAADLFVLGSESEGLPLSVLEAMATGLPVVAYELPGLRSVINEGVDGVLVPLGDRLALSAEISALLLDDERRVVMGAAARRSVTSSYDARLMTRRVEGVYDEVLGRAPRIGGRGDANAVG